MGDDVKRTDRCDATWAGKRSKREKKKKTFFLKIKYFWLRSLGSRAPLSYLLERDMHRRPFPFPVGEDTPQTTLSHPNYN